jgi:dienelactone hydrolase
MADIKAPPAPGPHIAAVFEPTASPPAIPLPNDLVKTGGDGVHLNVPDQPTDSPAQLDLNHYLNTLDGFPSSTPGSFSFSGVIDPATLTVGTPTMNGAVLIFNATGMQPLGPGDYTLAVAADGKSVTITPTKRWTPGSQYVVVVFGGSDPAGIKGAMGETVLASPTFFFLRSPNPVVGLCGNGDIPACVCPQAALMDPTDKTCHSVVQGLSDAQARQLEPQRQIANTALEQLLPFAGSDNNGPRKRENVVLMWSFTIASSPEAIFDPTRGDVPFPNDVLIDQTTNLVKLPIPAGDPQAAIKMGLNMLDGFSTTAPATLPVDSDPSGGDIDAATVVPQMSVVMLGVTAQNGPEFSAAPVFVSGGTTFAGQIAITPTSALESDQVRYAVAVTSDVKDVSGRNLIASPLTVLVRGTNPLVDGNGHSTVSILDDASAAQLEVLRNAEAALFDGLEMGYKIPRKNVAAAWTFTTQSEVRPLLALDELPSKVSLTTNVTITHTTSAADIATVAASLPYPTAHLGGVVFGTLTTEHAADPTTTTINFDRTTTGPDARFSVRVPASPILEPVKFVLALPNSSGPWPVAIVQHGITTWRGEMMPVVDSFAAAGWATILIDLPFHGARSVCTADNQCNSNAAGACNVMTGQCMGGLKLATPSMDPLACSLQPLSGDPSDCNPLASGAAFVNPNNLFGTRDNLRQYVVDARQLMRVVQDSANTMGLAKQIAPTFVYDPTKIGFLGMSLGSITGALFLAVAPDPQTAVLNVGGGHLIQIIAAGDFSTLLQPLLQAMNITPDTPAFFQLENTATWILDPADAFALGAHLTRAPVTSYLTSMQNQPKRVIVQEHGKDTTIPPQFEAALSREILGPIGLDQAGHAQGITTGGMRVSTFFADAVHSSLILPLPSAAVTASIQAQAVTFISSAGSTLVAP